ncbi:hypothetical protein RB195_021838 [Necator americanus]|uniref:Uncharacterized protein n=1 Tax=Necator americanus TaxID=51031 RepID=A0ABR1ECU2_NECAM
MPKIEKTDGFTKSSIGRHVADHCSFSVNEPNLQVHKHQRLEEKKKDEEQSSFVLSPDTEKVEILLVDGVDTKKITDESEMHDNYLL